MCERIFTVELSNGGNKVISRFQIVRTVLYLNITTIVGFVWQMYAMTNKLPYEHNVLGTAVDL